MQSDIVSHNLQGQMYNKCYKARVCFAFGMLIYITEWDQADCVGWHNIQILSISSI